MATVLPKCPRCGSHNVTVTHFDTHTKARTYRCNDCYKKFTERFVSSVYNVPMQRDNGTEQHDAQIRNEQRELHDFWDCIDYLDYSDCTDCADSADHSDYADYDDYHNEARRDYYG